MIRTRIAAVLAVLPLICALCFAAYKFGPAPSSAGVQSGLNEAAEVKPATTDTEQTASSQLFKVFGMYETAVARGRVNISAAEYLNSLAELYRQRGYEELRINDVQGKTRWTSKLRTPKKVRAQKFFHRQETNGISTLWATGYDADYTTDKQSSEPYSFSTLVTPSQNGGADWATYRMQIDAGKLKQLGNLATGDFPGTDPLNIPRPAGLQRIYAFSSPRGSIVIYKSNETETALIAQYLQELPRHGWRLDPEVTSNANKVAQGVMCFTRGQRFCMIWVTRSKDSATTTVTISSH